MFASHNALRLIKEFEGLRLKAYRCPAGVATVGWGSTGPDIKIGMSITMAEAETLLCRDLARRAKVLVDQIGGYPTTQAQFDAMLSLSYNIGSANFAKSSVLRHHTAGRHDNARRAFAAWNKATIKGKLTVLPGLVRRRAAEAALYAS